MQGSILSRPKVRGETDRSLNQSTLIPGCLQFHASLFGNNVNVADSLDNLSLKIILSVLRGMSRVGFNTSTLGLKKVYI